LIICIAEDRECCEPGLKLLILSLDKHCRELPVIVFYPPAGAAFRSWVGSYPQVTVHTAPLPGAHGWNVKPQAILHLMDQGYDQIVWIDSDIIVNRDFTRMLNELPPSVLAITEEALWGAHEDPDCLRARLWGFDAGRNLPFTLNTAVLRVTRLHYGLLGKWREILESEQYRTVQQKSWIDRPVHMVGDQDVLTAILSSAEYAQIPLRILARGKEIIQFFGLYGYTMHERALRLVHGRPYFIHSQGIKPWLEGWHAAAPMGLRKYIESVYLDLSPYTIAASSFRTRLDCDSKWMTAHYKLSAIMRGAAMWYMPLVGLPIALVSDLMRVSKRGFRSTHRRP